MSLELLRNSHDNLRLDFDILTKNYMKLSRNTSV